MRDQHPDDIRTSRQGRLRRALLLLALLWLLPLPAVVPVPASADEDAPPKEEAPAADDATPNARSALELKASAVFKTLGSLGQEDFRFTLDIHNPTEKPLKLMSGNLFLSHLGGWLAPLDPDSIDGSFFRGTLLIPGGENVPGASSKYRSVSPATHTLLVARVTDGFAHIATPILRESGKDEAWQAPRAYDAPYPFGIGLVGPLHLLPFSDGEESILLMGQHQVLDGRQPTSVETSVVLGNDSGAGEPISWSGLDAQGDLTALWPFVRRIPAFEGFEKGLLRIQSTVVLDGKEHEFTGTWPVEKLTPVPLLSPVIGTWQLSNGPGQKEISPQDSLPQQRYAYDMVVLRKGRTHSGDPHLNTSYHAFGRTIRAVAVGEVVDVCDHEPDNPGYRGSLTQCFNNRVVIKHPPTTAHPGGYYSIYLHLKKGSKKMGINLGSRVRAGQPIAQVGNSGNSSEPHLHFQVFRIGATGRIQGLPVSFKNAYHDHKGTRPVKGVALSGSTYYFRSK